MPTREKNPKNANAAQNQGEKYTQARLIMVNAMAMAKVV